MNKSILHIALPAIIANITVPLLGFIDTGIAGHLGKTEYIGAIAVGSMIFNLIYWNFGFLRMGTSGITAQAYGHNDLNLAKDTLIQAISMALVIAITIILLQYPIQWLAFTIIAPSVEVQTTAEAYYKICIWNAPAILSTMAIHGWFLGMQDSTRPMYISIGVNIVNIITSIIAVFVCDMGFIGIAFGTLIASYIGLLFSLLLIFQRHKNIFTEINWNKALKLSCLNRFFSINSDIFMRSLCLMLVTLFFTAQGAGAGDTTLAANTLIMQLFILFSYFMDGFAFAGEAIVGKFTGAKDYDNRKRCIKHLFGWGFFITIIFTLIYGSGLQYIFSLITNDSAVISSAMQYKWWCIAIPFAGMAAFIWDGVFIGMTATRSMLISVFCSSCAYFGLFYILPKTCENHRLWLSFITYLALRGAIQTFIYFKRII